MVFLLLHKVDCELRYTKHLSARLDDKECKSPSEVRDDLCWMVKFSARPIF